MSLENYSREGLTSMAMVELASVILEDANKELDFREIFDKLTEIKGYKEEQKQDFLARFYTDLNIDGRFMTLGSNKWGLKRWYPVEQIDEQIAAEPKKKKKSNKKKKKKEESEEEVEEKVEEEAEKEPDVIDKDIEKGIDDNKEGLEDHDEEDSDDEELDDEEFVEEDDEQEEDDEEEKNAK